ncbi:hypothetical protein K7X08_020874 [Anisodus acutangulus]|uniref:MATH domain-containing protein n=1 Tax=Anisodus acutangulus TaxID=402998 RepID=A0A9Q1RQE0_9SOLA|nr:hypothetical protein K7X08_020874 [Anisodus acutangulus]
MFPAASFTLQDCKWKLELYPKGYPADEHSDLALGIRLDDTTKRVYADYKLKIKNQADGKDVMATGSTGFGGISKSKSGVLLEFHKKLWIATIYDLVRLTFPGTSLIRNKRMTMTCKSHFLAFCLGD